MLFADSIKLAGEIDIRILDRSGKETTIWQEYQILHYFRKHYGINFPRIFGVTGYFTKKATYQNLITTSGKGLISGRVNGVGSPGAPTTMAIGIGTTPAAAGDTDLETILTGDGLDAGAGTATLQTTTVANDTCRLVKAWTSSRVADVAVTEMGIKISGSTLLLRNVFSAYTLRTGDTFEITHNLKNA